MDKTARHMAMVSSTFTLVPVETVVISFLLQNAMHLDPREKYLLLNLRIRIALRDRLAVPAGLFTESRVPPQWNRRLE